MLGRVSNGWRKGSKTGGWEGKKRDARDGWMCGCMQMRKSCQQSDGGHSCMPKCFQSSVSEINCDCYV